MSFGVPWWLPFGSVPEVDAAELARSLSGSGRPLLIDVREPSEWSAGHIAGSVNVPIARLPARLESLEMEPGRPVVAICLSGHRSIPAVRLLSRRSAEVRQLRGGMLAWRRAGLPERAS